MLLGAEFPTREIGTDPRRVREFAATAESAGYHHLLTANRDLLKNLDRPDRDDRYGIDDAFYAPLVLYGHLAAVTDGIELLTAVLVLPQRQTVLAAKQAAALDVLSEGRLRLGIGVGSDPVSYEALGQDWTSRGRRVEEQVELMRRFWTTELVSFDGEFHAIDDAGITPRPVQRPIPVWMGGGKADVVLRRIARLADGWIPSGSWSTETLEDRLGRVHAVMEEHGRSPDELGLQGRLTLEPDRPEAWLDGVRRWQDLGATHLAVSTMDVGRDVDEHGRAIERLADVVDDAGVLD